MEDKVHQQALVMNEQKRDFLRYILHEVRVPLNALVMGLEGFRIPRSTAMASAVEEDDLDALREMRHSVSHMTSLLDDVLVLQRMEDGELQLVRAPFDIRMVLPSVLKMMTIWLEKKQLQPRVVLIHPLPRLVGDEYRLRQVLVTFLSNAIRFSSGNRATILLAAVRCTAFSSSEPIIATWGAETLSRYSPDASHLYNPRPTAVFIRVSVRDFGIGISESDLQRMFKPFVHIQSGESVKGKKTGLGLSFCRKLVELLGGRVGVISSPGKGSEFFLEAPFDVCDLDISPEKIKQEPLTELRTSPSIVEPRSVSAEEWNNFGVLDHSTIPHPRLLLRHRSSPTKSAVETIHPQSPSVLSSPSLGSSDVRNRSTTLHMLVVDDSTSNRKMLIRLLVKRMSCSCDEAGEGLQAISLIQNDVTRYDAILCDKEMPIMDGHEAVRRMRALGVVCPIVGVTANALTADQQEFIACGLDGLVTKPVNIEMLTKMIYGLIESKGGQRRARG
jgi:signal transduction histidine kinase/ActR/RegA family two-component response regulator